MILIMENDDSSLENDDFCDSAKRLVPNNSLRSQIQVLKMMIFGIKNDELCF